MRQGLLFLLAAPCLFAQTERGTITGVVADPSGAAVANATVSVINPSTNSTALLPAAGRAATPLLTSLRERTGLKSSLLPSNG